MNKKVFSALALSAIIIPSVVGLTACNNQDPASMSVRDVYAMSAISSISYLSKVGNEASLQNATTRPNTVTDFDVEGIKNSLSMFDTTIDNGGFLKTIQENTSQDANLSQYGLQMDISFPTQTGDQKVCTMYFTEKDSVTKTEIDEGVKEIETSTFFEGVISYDSKLYVVRGETEVETEGRKTESSIEFRTYKTDANGEIDSKNYVEIEHSTEDNEVEYEYKLVNDGKIQAEIELEYEQTKNGVVVEFEQKDKNIHNETKYKITKGEGEKFVVVINKNGQKETVTVEKQADGKYTFTYANNHVETV